MKIIIVLIIICLTYCHIISIDDDKSLKPSNYIGEMKFEYFLNQLELFTYDNDLKIKTGEKVELLSYLHKYNETLPQLKSNVSYDLEIMSENTTNVFPYDISQKSDNPNFTLKYYNDGISHLSALLSLQILKTVSLKFDSDLFNFVLYKSTPGIF